MRFAPLAILALLVGISGPLFAGEAADKKVKALEVPMDVATDIIKKTNAFFQGNLEITMPPDKDKYKNKANYTTNAIGQKVPKATVTG